MQAQIDTLLLMPSVDVEGVKVREGAIGASLVQWKDSSLNEIPRASIADFLQRKANIYVKTYGGNSLSTLSIRGASGSQNLVTWNGLPVQSAMLGLLDLSLIPVALADEIALETGGNSSSWGSGAIGGLLSFKQHTSFKNKFQLNYSSSIGSFGSLHQGLSFQVGNKYFQSRTQVVYQRAQNDIIYSIAPNFPTKRQENAYFEQPALIQTFAIRPKENHLLELHFWLQKSYKEIPPTLVQTKSEAFQTDRFKRFMANYRFFKGKHQINAKAAAFQEEQNFQDPQIGIDANNDFTNYLTEISYKFQINKVHAIELANTNVLTRAKSNSYEELEKLDRYGMLFAYKLQGNKIDLQLSIREEIANSKVLLPVGYAGVDWQIAKNFLFKSKLTRDFRLPTLNDLFWSPGGNADLLPEEGWSQEIGVEYVKQLGKHKCSFSQVFFNRNIKNWILWAPSNTGVFWQANNIAKVWSWGSESKFTYSFSHKKVRFRYVGMFNYISSTYQTNLDLPRIRKGDQLLYTPEIQSNNTLELGLGIWRLNYEHLIVGETQAVNGVLEAYNLANISSTWTFNQEKVQTILFVTVNNVFNQNYIVVERRPSPGINYQVGMQLNFKK